MVLDVIKISYVAIKEDLDCVGISRLETII